MAKAPAYMSVKFEANSGTNKSIISTELFGNQALQAKGIAIENIKEHLVGIYIFQETKLIERYDCDFTIAITRCVIIKFAARGTAEPPVIEDMPGQYWDMFLPPSITIRFLSTTFLLHLNHSDNRAFHAHNRLVIYTR
ncbi:hypothetical protein FOZG_09531 [Fusarium oxysporum Fo47]|uniref:Uncharacterized protein n=1 Tax=Fusarium oxysporum Fo47 TaxID=660027 RepID=W9JZG6_FUSOX|nr:hypothetical protein FOZG_09531 [Fusarium oxysporum Fo47]